VLSVIFKACWGAREFPTGRRVGFHSGNSRLGQHPTEPGSPNFFGGKKGGEVEGEGNRARDSVTNREDHLDQPTAKLSCETNNLIDLQISQSSAPRAGQSSRGRANRTADVR
jgi:hypothetical protein